MPRLAVAVLISLLIAGCNDDAPPANATEPPAATANCSAAEIVPIQGQGHLVGDQEPPVPYNSTPPTSGWHTSTDVPTGIAEEPLTEPEQVTVLEQGGIVITHNGLDREQREQLESLVSVEHAAVAALTLYDKIDSGEVVFTAWGALQRCTAVDPEAAQTFIETYAQR